MNRTYDEVEAWLVSQVATLAEADPDSIDIDKPFIDYRLDSSVAVTLAHELGRWMGRELSPTLFWEYPNISTLADALTDSQSPRSD
jgi:acyl carrier protein